MTTLHHVGLPRSPQVVLVSSGSGGHESCSRCVDASVKPVREVAYFVVALSADI